MTDARDGREIIEELRALAGGDERWTALAARLADHLDRRERAEAVLRAAAARDAYRVRLGEALRALSSPAEIKAAAARILAEAIAPERVVYVEIDGDDCVMESTYVRGVPPVDGRLRVDDFGPLINAELRAGRPVVIDDTVSDPRISLLERTNYAGAGIGANVGVPLVKDGRWVAACGVHAAAARRWTADEVALVQETAEATWAAVERARAEAALRVADRRKDEFLAMLGHELRNPLTPLQAGLEVLGMAQGEPETVERVRGVMQRQVEHMVRLVDDLLDVARITRGTITLRRAPAPLTELVTTAVEANRAVLDDRGVELVFEPPSAPCVLDVDATRIVQVLSNLMHNAAKYTPRGGRVTVRARAEAGEAVISVRDTGVGIPRDMLGRVFDLFTQVQRDGDDRMRGGLGLGLTLVKRLVELHGGSVRASSDGAGAGTEFTLRVPLAAAAAAAAEPRPACPQPLRGRALVVDDNREAAGMIATLLERLGVETRTAFDGPAALDTLDGFAPSVVFLDIGMPGMDGYEVARRIRERLGGAVTLVALTGWGQPEDRRRSFQASIDHHLVKPARVAALRAILAAAPPQSQGATPRL